MDSVKLVPLLVGLLIAVVMVGAVFVPVVQSSTTRTITTEIENEGAEWLKLGYNQGTDYSFTVGFDGEDNFNVGTQTGEYENLICYADNERTLFVSGDYWYLLTTGESPSVYKFTDNASVTNASGTLTILDGSETVYTGASPTWAYVPDSNGVYGFFTDGGLNLEEGKPTVAVGSYAGVFAYNDTVVASNGFSELGLTMSGDYSEGEVIWMVAPSELDTLSTLPTDTLEPAVIDLDPISIQPIDLGGSGSVSLMAVGTPTYTDGDWGYDVQSGKATIVSYSGVGGVDFDLVIPDTIGGYPVNIVGKSGYTVVPTSFVARDLVIPDGVVAINTNAFQSCVGFKGKLIIADSVEDIYGSAFSGCTGFKELQLSKNAMIDSSAFKGCSGFSSLTLPTRPYYVNAEVWRNCSGLSDALVITDNYRGIRTNSFAGCTNLTGLVNLSDTVTFESTSFTNTGIKEILNLGAVEITTTTGGMNAETVQDHVTALGYIAPTSIRETEVIPIDSPVAGLMQLLPLIAGIGALFLAVGTMIYTRF